AVHPDIYQDCSSLHTLSINKLLHRIGSSSRYLSGLLLPTHPPSFLLPLPSDAYPPAGGRQFIPIIIGTAPPYTLLSKYASIGSAVHPDNHRDCSSLHSPLYYFPFHRMHIRRLADGSSSRY
ncbi:MAG: hypothetical protein SH819_09180, partial [Cytophagales bacterium]|nr:hypothetical protein [Cytophagales bacterium]